MGNTIPEIEAREIVTGYTGFNNQILEWKKKFETVKNYALTRPQSEYVIKYHQVEPKVARKYVQIAKHFGNKLQEERLLMQPVEQVWIEKLLCESDKAYHIWGNINKEMKPIPMWIPKASIIQEEKKLNREIDYSPYSKRPPMSHQKVAIEKLLANDRFILADDMGLGKAEYVKNKVFTPNGRKEIGQLKVGDQVIGSNGDPCNVIGVFPQGKKELYRVTFNDGTSILCCDEHLWTVSSSSSGKNNKNRNERYVTLSVKQMLDENGKTKKEGFGWNKKRKYEFSTYYKKSNGNSKWQIPIVDPIEFHNNEELPIDPYLLGLLLGDGGLTHTIRFSSVDEEIIDSIESLLSEGMVIKKVNSRGCDYSIVNDSKHSNPLIDILRNLGVMGCNSYNKFIPDIYKYSKITDRIKILQGLMDTDGTCMVGKKMGFHGTEFSTSSKQLADDVIEIVNSLGGIARKRSRIPKYTYKGVEKEGHISFRVNIKLNNNINPFKLKRKRDLYNEPQKYKVGRYIKDIQFERIDEAVCISVDSPDKLYVTDHAIVTHNTTSTVIASMESGAKKVLIVCPASLKINWKREIENYTDEYVLIVEGKKWGSTYKYYIINYDILKNFHTTENSEDSEAYQIILNEGFDLAIVDEAHYISNSQAQRTKLLNDILAKIPKVWLLTGTPMTSRPINYYNLLRIVNSPLTLNWKSYVMRYCKGYQFRVGGRKIWNTSGASNLDELREQTKAVVLRRLKTDVLDLPEKIISPIWLELKNSFYDDELTEFLRISEENKEKESITVTLNRLMKLRQLIAIEKVEHTCELIDKVLEQGKKVIVFTNFTMSLDMIHEKFKKKSVVLDGRMSKIARQESVDRFQNEDKIKIFIGNIKAAGVGITLTEADTVIMNDLSFVPADHSQAEDRAYRYGQKNSVLVYYPVFENTIEMTIYNILQKKKDIIDQVMGDGEYSESFASELVKSIK